MSTFKGNQYVRVSNWKRLTIAIIFLAGGILGTKAWFMVNPTVKVKEVPVTVDTSSEMFQTKISQLKSDIADKLMACESAGLTEDTGIIVFDTNNKASVGQFQFQKATVIHYYKLLYGKDITGKEAVMIALETKIAKQLAIDIMFKTPNKAGKDWVNCTNRYNLDAQIDLVKKLEA